MGFKPLDWYCKPVPNGVWSKMVDYAFGAYTPCAIDSFVLGISHLVLLILCVYRIWLTVKDHRVEKFCLRSKWYSYFLALLAAYSTAEPLFRLVMRISLLDLDAAGFPPYEAFMLGLEALAWGSALVMTVVETKTYIRELRWYVRFAVIYALLGDMVLLNLVLSVKEYYGSFKLYLYISEVAVQVAFGTLLFVYFPNLDPYAGYTPVPAETSEDYEYEELPGGEQICPERHANLFDRIFFSWLNPLMTLGSKRPLTEKDVWHLDTWDRTETLMKCFQMSWEKELEKPKPWLLRALNNSLGGRFWWGGFWKIGNDCSQFVGPLLLNELLKSMQLNEPAWIGYIYAISIFVGVVLGVLCEAQYFQNVMRVGYRLRSALIAAVFRKSLRLTNEGRKKFQTGKITNLMTTDAESLQQICQSLHTMWSAPFRIIVSLVLLYQQLGVASLIGALFLVLMFPIQTVIISKTQKLTKEGLQRTDKRIGLMNEVLAAMDTVKCYAWENSFQSKVQTVRDDELSWFRKAQLLSAFNMFILNSIPVFVTVVSFGVFSLLGGDLTPARAFTALSLFSVLRFPLFMLPNIITQAVNAKVSLTRLEEVLSTEERVLLPNPPIEPGQPAISIRNGYFSWDSKAERPTLLNINLDVPVGSLVAVVGSTGEGKTSLISAMLGELPAISDAIVTLRGSVAYVPQVSWIFNATVRDNILFGAPFDKEKYERVIDVTALRHDLELLPGGDLTEIGERGVNISGGQKQRVSMARAVYSNSDVCILDDPLSALDAHVGQQVFEKCIKRELADKTRVLVTNQLHFLSQVDKILLVHEGTVKEEGTYEELSHSGPLFQRLMENAGKVEEYSEENEEAGADQKSVKQVENGNSNNPQMEGTESKKSKEGNSVLVKREERETGVVSWKVLKRYQDALGGGWVVMMLLICYVLTQVFRVASSTWLSEWTDAGTPKSHGPLFYNLIYAILSFGQVFVTLVNSYWLIMASLYAAKKMHDAMLGSILRAPMVFFQTNPLGRIINRFAKDMGDIDRTVAVFVNMFMGSIAQLLSTIILIGIVSTLSLWAIMPLLVVFYGAYLYYQNTSREVKRMDSVSRSPVYAQFGEALNGLSSIRAYKAYDRMAEINGRSMDNNIRFTLVNMGANRWLAKPQRTKPTSRSQRLVLLCIVIFASLLLLSSVISTGKLGLPYQQTLIDYFVRSSRGKREHTLSEKYLYWGNRIDCPGKNCETCAGLGHQESSLRCALEEAMFLNRTFVMPSGMCINPIHNKKGILNRSDNKTTEEGWVGSSCAMDSLYDIDLISEKVPVILDDSKTWHLVLSTSMKLEERGIAHVYGVSRHRLTESHYSNLLIINRTASPLAWFVECKDRGNRSAVMLPYSFLPNMAAANLRDAAEKIKAQLGDYDAIHVRRGDKLKTRKDRFGVERIQFPHLDRDTRPEFILHRIEKLIPPGRTLYIGSNERTPGFFSPLAVRYKLAYSSNFSEVLDPIIKNNYQLFMVERLVMMGARIYFKTFREYETDLTLTDDPKKNKNWEIPVYTMDERKEAAS